MSLDVENKCRDIQERYRTLAMYDITVSISIYVIIMLLFHIDTI